MSSKILNLNSYYKFFEFIKNLVNALLEVKDTADLFESLKQPTFVIRFSIQGLRK